MRPQGKQGKSIMALTTRMPQQSNEPEVPMHKSRAEYDYEMRPAVVRRLVRRSGVSVEPCSCTQSRELSRSGSGVKSISKQWLCNHRQSIYGFDTEWKPVFVKGQQSQLSTVQIATSTSAIVIQWNSMPAASSGQASALAKREGLVRIQHNIFDIITMHVIESNSLSLICLGL